MPRFRDAQFRHALYYAETLRRIYDSFKRGESIKYPPETDQDSHVVHIYATGDLPETVQDFDEAWDQFKTAEAWAKHNRDTLTAEEEAQLSMPEIPALNLRHVWIKWPVELVEEMKGYAALFKTANIEDIERAFLRFSQAIYQLRAMGRTDVLDEITETLYEPIRSLRASKHPFDPNFEAIFHLFRRSGSYRSTPLLLEMVQWDSENDNYVIIREMAAEAIADIADPAAFPAILKLARKRQAPRSPRRCAVLALSEMKTMDAEDALRSLVNDPVVGDLARRFLV